jgi:putative NADH-flavin reductase
MKVFVLGASGATGRLLTEQLLEKGHAVRAVVRSPEKLPVGWMDNKGLEITRGSLLEMDAEELSDLLVGCDAVLSCLGHHLTGKGIWGKPRRLVRDATSRLCELISAEHPEHPVKFVLMNTTGNRNRDLNEKRSMGHRIVITLLRTLLPPQADNEQAAEFLRMRIGQKDPHLQWVVVRPDGLVDEDRVSTYEIHPSPTRDPIFNAGKTSRINVAHFMAELVSDKRVWEQWKGQMPVIYNQQD